MRLDLATNVVENRVQYVWRRTYESEFPCGFIDIAANEDIGDYWRLEKLHVFLPVGVLPEAVDNRHTVEFDISTLKFCGPSGIRST